MVYIGRRAVKFIISTAECDYCLHSLFAEVFNFVKDVCNVEILNLKPKTIKCCFVNVFDVTVHLEEVSTNMKVITY